MRVSPYDPTPTQEQVHAPAIKQLQTECPLVVVKAEFLEHVWHLTGTRGDNIIVRVSMKAFSMAARKFTSGYATAVANKLLKGEPLK